jgi:O-antigen ligase
MARYRAQALPLVAGLLVGAVAVGTSNGSARTPFVAIALVAGCIAAGLVRCTPGFRLPRRLIAPGVVIAAAGCGVTVFLLRSEIWLRLLDPVSLFDRNPEWSAAWQQIRNFPMTGVGPDRILPFVGDSQHYAYFAHNEYLQIAADTGVVGVALLASAIFLVIRTLRRRDDLSSCAVGAMIAFAVCGVFDFDWHLPALGILGGWAFGLARGANQSKAPDISLDLSST